MYYMQSEIDCLRLIKRSLSEWNNGQKRFVIRVVPFCHQLCLLSMMNYLKRNNIQKTVFYKRNKTNLWFLTLFIV
jgi:hypothetical protein